MPPEFSKSKKDVLGKRAGYLCSNPECRAATSGPTSDPSTALIIGEAAHIFGALPGAARYRQEMTDGARAEITNGIWLCRNCHKLTDSDPVQHPVELLFAWKSEHEQFVTARLGNRNDILRSEMRERAIADLFDGNMLAKEIVREKLPFWEYRLTAEMLRFRLQRPAKEWDNLRRRLVTRNLTALDDAEVPRWLQIKMKELIDLIHALEALYTIELKKAWGPPGEPGDPEAIDQVCNLIGRAGNELIRWEESVHFVWVSEFYQSLIDKFPGIAGRQLEKLLGVPNVLDEGIDHAEANPEEKTVIRHTVTFDFEEGWEESISEGCRIIEKKISERLDDIDD